MLDQCRTFHTFFCEILKKTDEYHSSSKTGQGVIVTVLGSQVVGMKRKCKACENIIT